MFYLFVLSTRKSTLSNFSFLIGRFLFYIFVCRGYFVLDLWRDDQRDLNSLASLIGVKMRHMHQLFPSQMRSCPPSIGAHGP